MSCLCQLFFHGVIILSNEAVRIYEVGARDGLQNEKAAITTADKLRLLEGLLQAGITHLEVTSFVSAKAVPMLADAPEVMRHVRTIAPAVQAMGLIFNEKGYENALAAGCRAIALVLIVSDSLSRSNSGKTADDWLPMYRTLLQRAKQDGVWVRGYLAAAWVCPFEGQISAERVLRYGDFLWEHGVDELCPTDPIGHAHPLQVGALMETLGKRYDMARLAVHLHDTQALALANATAALSAGVRRFDTSIGGLGGCPFAPGAAGNLATEDLVLLLHKMGYTTGIAWEKLWSVVQQFEPIIGRRMGGRSRAWYESSLVQVPSNEL
jgi:hydroxymethylglutaryl-CoA lyase